MPMIVFSVFLSIYPSGGKRNGVVTRDELRAALERGGLHPNNFGCPETELDQLMQLADVRPALSCLVPSSFWFSSRSFRADLQKKK